eukprot:jgi/Botrbrau1/9078/Bobra.178_2s0010.1
MPQRRWCIMNHLPNAQQWTTIPTKYLAAKDEVQGAVQGTMSKDQACRMQPTQLESFYYHGYLNKEHAIPRRIRAIIWLDQLNLEGLEAQRWRRMSHRLWSRETCFYQTCTPSRWKQSDAFELWWCKMGILDDHRQYT